MKFDDVKIDPNGDTVSVKIQSPQHPQSIAGIVWRYNSNKEPDGQAGPFSTSVPDVFLGEPHSISEKFFLVEGAVLHQNDNPPTPYQILIFFFQGDRKIHQTVPELGGSGEVGTDDKPFVYRFKIQAT